MPCYKPLLGYRSKNLNSSGKRSIIFNPAEAICRTAVIRLPCGQCIYCRLNHSREHAICCVHEASLYESNCFLTLTYSPERLPPLGTLNKKHFQDFMKRFRSKYAPREIRVLYCGEYGDKGSRPHYHACVFNFDFSDKEVIGSNFNDDKYYKSKELEDLWGHGFCLIGELTFESAAYVARYTLKKKRGPGSEFDYMVVDENSGFVVGERTPEFAHMSQSIGRGWFEKFKSDVYPLDEVIVRGVKMRPPKRYDRFLEKTDPQLLEKIKRERNDQETKVKKAYDDINSTRLVTREDLHHRKMEQLIRRLDNGKT